MDENFSKTGLFGGTSAATPSTSPPIPGRKKGTHNRCWHTQKTPITGVNLFKTHPTFVDTGSMGVHPLPRDFRIHVDYGKPLPQGDPLAELSLHIC